MRMKFTVPVDYTAKVVSKGKRNAVSTTFFEWVEIEVEELSPQDAPIAVFWNDRMLTSEEQSNHNHRAVVREMGRAPADGNLHTRYHNDGHYWFNVLHERQGSDEPGYKETAEQFQNRLLRNEGGYPLSIKPVAHWVFSEHPEGFPLRTGDYRSVEGSDREERIQAVVTELQGNLIVVDSYAYFRKPEPVYVLLDGIDLPNDDWQLWIKVVPNDPKLLKLPYSEQLREVYAIDRFDDAKAVSLAGWRAQERPSINEGKRATVVIETSIKADTESQVMYEAAKDVVRFGAKVTMDKFSRDEAISYVNLRQAVDRYEKTKDINAIFDAAVCYRDCLLTGSYSDMKRDKLNIIIDRHLMKPLSM